MASTSRTESTNPYQDWDCAFEFFGHVNPPAEIPNTKHEFISAVEAGIASIGFIQEGLVSYLDAIHSGVYDVFPQAFLRHETDASHRTIGQLFHISHDLRNVVREVRASSSSSTSEEEEKEEQEHGEQEEGRTTTTEVQSKHKAAFAHAQPWINRARAILVSCHVFYKINYVLGSQRPT